MSLADYAQEHGPHTSAPWRVAYAVTALAGFWEGRTVVEVTKEACRRYGAWRGRSQRGAVNASRHCSFVALLDLLSLLAAPLGRAEGWW